MDRDAIGEEKRTLGCIIGMRETKNSRMEIDRFVYSFWKERLLDLEMIQYITSSRYTQTREMLAEDEGSNNGQDDTVDKEDLGGDFDTYLYTIYIQRELVRLRDNRQLLKYTQ